MACVLCNFNKKDEILYGEFLKEKKIAVHEFCLYLSSGLVQKGKDDEGIYGFLPKHILQESERAEKLNCCYCQKKCASIGCCENKCRRSFHLICGLENGAENHFTGSFNSYCDKHGRKRKRPPRNEFCCICYDSLADENGHCNSRKVVMAPCCKNGWFHKNCLQGFARSSGYFFKCPLCNDTEKFRAEMPHCGIFIRDADAAWELEPNAFNELLERPSKCEAEVCHHRMGREALYDERNPLLYCQTCGAVAVHKLCNSNGHQTFICADCQKIVDSRASSISVGDGDSCQESSQVDGDKDGESDEDENEDEESIDICNVSEKDDDSDNDNNDDDDEDDEVIVPRKGFKKLKRLMIEDDSDDENSIRYSTALNSGNFMKTEQDFCIQKSKNTKNLEAFEKSSPYETANDDSESTSTCSSYKDSESSPFKSIRNRRKNVIKDSSETSGCSPNVTSVSFSIDDLEDDMDPLDYIPELMTGKIDPTKKAKIKHDSQPHSSSKINAKNHKEKQIFKQTNGNEHSENTLPKFKTSNTIVALQKENRDILPGTDDNVCENNDNKKDPFEISCIAKRTRRRSSAPILNQNSPDKRLRSESSTSSTGSTDENFDVSCIANRTRRRKSIHYIKNNLAMVGEENVSESSESYQTPSKRSKYSNERFNGTNDEGFHSGQSSRDVKSSHTMLRSSLRKSSHKSCRLMSLSTDDDQFGENDSMKNR